MISPDALSAWRVGHPWPDDEQVEQDLIMTRVAIEIGSHAELRDRLAWRGGTCLHKLFLPMPLRYSEDLDYVAYDLSVEDNDMRRLRSGLRDVADRVGLEVGRRAKTTRDRLAEHFNYRSLGGAPRRIKIEVNLDEVPAVQPLGHRPLATATDWWTGGADLLTFSPVELIATKFRARAQRSKGRDLNDLDVAHRQLELDDQRLGETAAHYLFHADVPPSQFRERLAAHLQVSDFVNDVARYLVDPAIAGKPTTLVHRWILWTDTHLDLPFARLALETNPSKRRQQAVQKIELRLASGANQCPVHERGDRGWRRCDGVAENGACAVHRAPEV